MELPYDQQFYTPRYKPGLGKCQNTVNLLFKTAPLQLFYSFPIISLIQTYFHQYAFITLTTSVLFNPFPNTLSENLPNTPS